MTRILLASVFAGLLACGSSPPVRYYQIALPESERAPAGQGVLAIERLTADAAYDDARIVYRESPYRLDYYHYHRWSAAPAVMISDYLRVAYQKSGTFRSVVSGYSGDADVILSGRLMALEEVNHSEEPWHARVRLDLRLRSARSGELLWSRVITESEPLKARDPEGLAAATAAAMERIVADTEEEIAAHIPSSSAALQL